jgi:DNA-binding transcriptional MerR regulator
MEKKQVIYNITKLAEKLGVPRQTIYYWIEKGWVKPKRDYRNYPVFTENDLEGIIKWKNSIK